MSKLILKELRSFAGAAVMAAFGFIAIFRFSTTGLVFFLLFAVRDFIAAYFFAQRKAPSRTASPSMTILSYVSSAFPLFYRGYSLDAPSRVATELLAIGGFLLVTLATIELADRMGVSPAKRGDACVTGVYRYLSHPMYVGYAIAELGLVIANPANLVVYFVSVTLYAVRACAEHMVLRRQPQASSNRS